MLSGKERCLQRRVVAPHARPQHVLLDPRRQVVGHRVLKRQVRVGIVLPRRAPHLAVAVAQQRPQRAVRHLVRLRPIAVLGRCKLQLAVGEDPVRRVGRAEGILYLSQHLLHLARTNMRAHPLEIVEVLGIDRQPRLFRHPAPQRIKPYPHQFRLGKGDRRLHLGPQAGGLPHPCRRRLVTRVRRRAQKRIHRQPLRVPHQRLVLVHPSRHHARPLAQPAGIRPHVRQPRLDLRHRRFPCGGRRIDTL